ncbi:MAG: recombinase family protein [Frondihabitans sp.]|nr:recombinase family protein [Frondihabitans sp.]
MDHGVSGAQASRPQFDQALDALIGGDVDTSTPTGPMRFTIIAALAQMEHEIKSGRITGSISKRKAAGQDLGGRPRRITDNQIRSALSLIEQGTPAAQVARDLR